jgi:hypothetical protein
MFNIQVLRVSKKLKERDRRLYSYYSMRILPTLLVLKLRNVNYPRFNKPEVNYLPTSRRILRNVGIFTSRHGITSHQTWIFSNTAVRTSNLAEEVPYRLQNSSLQTAGLHLPKHWSVTLPNDGAVHWGGCSCLLRSLHCVKLLNIFSVFRYYSPYRRNINTVFPAS